MKRVLAGMGVAGLAAMAMLGCSHSGDTAGDAGAVRVPPPGDTTKAQTSEAVAPAGEPATYSSITPVPPPLVLPDRLRTLLLPPDVSGPIVGSPLGFEKRFDQPAPPVNPGEHSECAVLLGPAMPAFGFDWTAYKGAQQKDREENADTVVGQGVGSYPDTDKAHAAFGAAFPSELRKCDGVAVHNPRDADANVTWQFHVTTVDGARVQWSRVQLIDGKPVDWSCAYESDVKSNVLLYTSVCRRGAGGAEAAAKLAERLMLWIPAV
ncbi:sensor domain-containing protein [[Mycobacterium] nativiensis]|uniref:Sensor domain-containing protein n=1 Tax=[Mycobacterium] nativiensis TaxID=2855503 RepID=A0ABU5Y3T9_9MYCO|nr:sensor domain-containing protein [Mycolicibacter sp. MYC340]MEB3034356.1 sensor domain-containing protein [Mycolicibacter sp. MYC340]